MTPLLRRRTAAPAIDERLLALGEAVDLAEGRLDPSLVAEGRSVLRRAGERLGLGLDLTVVALAGATGSGKSTIFNALAGAELSAAGVRRPTTGVTHACVWGEADAGPLLDWLGAARRHRRPAEGPLDGLVLLDLPDHDSTALDHRVEAERLVAVADLLVWVLDPQKYADAAVHERYLRPLAGHAGVTLVLLNQIDRLREPDRGACLADLRRLLEEDGLDHANVLAVSARTGEGMTALDEVLGSRVSARHAAVERLEADLDDVAAHMAASCSGRGRTGRPDRDRLVDALFSAAGGDTVVDAVAAAHRFRAVGATGWPFTRWLRRLRPDPLRRLHLGRANPDAADRTSLPPPTAVQRAGIATAVRDAAVQASGDGAEGVFPALVRRAAVEDEERLAGRLDRAIAGTDLGGAKAPRWWKVVGLLQVLLAAAVVAGVAWLLILFAVAWLQLPDPPLPRWGEVPYPTLLLLGGAASGLLVAGVARVAAGAGARRRARVAEKRLRSKVADVADAAVLRPVAAEIAAHDALCAAVVRAAGRREEGRRRRR